MSLIWKLITIYRQFQEYNKMLGIRDSLLFIFYELTKKKKKKVINLLNEEICIRTNSPDLKVTVRTLFDSEFDDIDLGNSSVIIDAGAYIGTSAIFFSKKYPTAKIFSIEIEDSNYEMLLKNVESFNNIIPIKAALWYENGTKTIQNRLTGHWGYTISNTFNEISSTGQTINCITILDIIKKYNISTIDILKMDIEGSEKKVLENSADWIDKVKVITAELHDRIINGCERSFYLATKDFTRFERKGEKITAYRK